MNQLGKTIAKKRISKRLTQKKLAELAYSSQSTIAKIENGLNISVQMLYLIADALDCTVVNILSESEGNHLYPFDLQEFLNFFSKQLETRPVKKATQEKLLILINEITTDYLKEFNYDEQY